MACWGVDGAHEHHAQDHQRHARIVDERPQHAGREEEERDGGELRSHPALAAAAKLAGVEHLAQQVLALCLWAQSCQRSA